MINLGFSGPKYTWSNCHDMNSLIMERLEFRGGKKNPNPLAHPNPPTNYPPKPTYLINGQMGASPIRPN
jgi:hypothetical protein